MGDASSLLLEGRKEGEGARVVDRTPHSKQNWFLQVLHSTEPNVATADSALTTVLQSGVGHHTMDRLAITIASCSRWVYLGRGEKKKGKVKSKMHVFVRS